MDVTLLGISMLVKPLQPEKAPPPMDVTVLGMVVFLQPTIRVLSLVRISALQLSRESYVALPAATTIDVRASQSSNTALPINVTLLPMVTLVKSEQPANARLQMDVTLLGMVTFVLY